MTDALRERLAASLSERYRLEREVGRGGMATVYLARDVRHDRNVALKVLDPDLGAVLGADRFLSEIRVTANLQHPNLLPLFDSGATDGLLWYVMPYVEGETLRARLDRERQLPIPDAVHLAVAIAGALDYAHQHGVIHRDLKPENILLQHGEPVVADFGIALAISNAGGQRVTQTGLSLGTPLYMSPEQATGDRVIDARSDIYSLGAVTYEMIAGEPPHTGASSQAIIARLMTEAARPLSSVRPSVPPNVEDAVQCALEKLPADRFSTAKEFADALRGQSGSPTSLRSARRHAGRIHASRGVVAALATTALAAISLAVLLARELKRPEQAPVQFVLDLPADQRLALGNGSSVALSPDGRTIAYVAAHKDLVGIYLRNLDSLVAHPFEPGQAGITPQFSPDGGWLAFRTANDLRRVPLSGGPAESLRGLLAWNGYSWGRNTDVLLSVENVVWRLGPGGVRTRLTTIDTARKESFHASPWLLTDDVFGFSLYAQKEGQLASTVGVARIGDAKHVDLGIVGDSPLGYVEGHLLYSSSAGTLLAVPFDARQLKVTGSPVALLDSVVWIYAGGLQLNLSPSGTLAYVRGSAGRRMSIVDVHGGIIAQTPEPREYSAAELSPDGLHVAFSLTSMSTGTGSRAFRDVWMWDVASGALNRLTTDGGTMPKWIDGGKRVEYMHCASAQCENQQQLWSVPIDGSTSPRLEHRLTGGRVTTMSIARSGRYAAFTVLGDTLNGSDVMVGDLSTTDVTLVPLVAGQGRQGGPLISPDERWVAYASDESGRFEIYLRPLRGEGGRTRVSVDGGSNLDWASDGRRIVYHHGTANIAAALDFSGTTPVVTRRDTLNIKGNRADIEPKTDKTLILGEPEDMRIVVVPNWLTRVRARLRGH